MPKTAEGKKESKNVIHHPSRHLSALTDSAGTKDILLVILGRGVHSVSVSLKGEL